ncbi:MAG: metallophosphoesterase family protein [Clostridiales bacterium]|nr:metallophosphoesterase family protein [Clostridiales bacterium]
MVIGVISDTHGKLTKQALEALKGSEIIIHAGDVGGAEILKALEEVAPVYAVRGNTDISEWGRTLPMTQMLEAGGKTIYVLHDIATMDLNPQAANIDIVIYGHSHIPKEERQDGILYFNPGSAGPRRFRLPVCLGRIRVENGEIDAQWINLDR